MFRLRLLQVSGLRVGMKDAILTPKFVEQNEKVQELATQYECPSAANHVLLRSRSLEVTQPLESERLLRLAASAGFLPAVNHVGIILGQKNQTDDAMLWLRRAANRGFKHSMAMVGILLREEGERLKKEGESKRAQAYFRESQKFYRKSLVGHEKGLEPHSVMAMTDLGYLLKMKGKNKEAMYWHEQSANAGNVTSMICLARLLMDQKKWKGALIWTQKATEQDDGPLARTAIVNMGTILNELNRPEEATAWNLKGAQMNIPVCCFRDATRLMDEALSSPNPDQKSRLLSEGLAMLNRGADGGFQSALFKRGILSLTAAMKEIDSPELKQYLLEKAGADLETTVRAENSAPVENYYYGVYLRITGDLEKAETHLLKALRGQTHDATLQLALVYEERDDVKQAEFYLKEAISYGIESAKYKYRMFLIRRSDAIHEQESQLLKKQISLDGSMGRDLEKAGEFGEKLESITQQRDENERQLEALEIERTQIDSTLSFWSDEDEVDTAASDSAQPHSSSAKLTEGTEGQQRAGTNEPNARYGELSKSYQRQRAREAKRQERQLLSKEEGIDDSTQPTYKTMKVTVLPVAAAEIIAFELKIQYFLSSLANGEVRGKLEPLKGFKGVFSLRLTKGKRLLIRVLEGNTNDGVTSLVILSADSDHYKDLNLRASSEVGPIPVSWHENEGHGDGASTAVESASASAVANVEQEDYSCG